jgi:hypothetical protein
LHFRLGAATKVDFVEVSGPACLKSVLRDVAADCAITAREMQPSRRPARPRAVD